MCIRMLGHRILVLFGSRTLGPKFVISTFGLTLWVARIWIHLKYLNGFSKIYVSIGCIGFGSNHGFSNMGSNGFIVHYRVKNGFDRNIVASHLGSRTNWMPNTKRFSDFLINAHWVYGLWVKVSWVHGFGLLMGSRI